MKTESESYGHSGVHLLILSLIVMTLVLGSVSAETWFGDPVKTLLPEEPKNLALGYFNSDTLVDVAYITSSRNLHVLYNSGGGHFTYSDVYQGGYYDLAAGDLDHYGGDDIVTVNSAQNEILIYFDDGDGLFEPPIFIPLSNQLEIIRIADLDSDGNNDVIGFGYSPPLAFESIYIFWGLQQGIEETPVSFECQIDPDCMWGMDTDANEMKIADLTGDGLLDVVVSVYGSHHDCSNDRAIALLRNLDNRQFPEVVEWVIREDGGPFNKTFWDFDMAYLNSDGLLDVATAWPSNPNIRTFHNIGDGQLEEGEGVENPLGAYWMVLADLNNDSLTDLAFSFNIIYPPKGFVYQGNGYGGFEEAQSLTTVLRDFEALEIDGHPGPELIGYNEDTLVVLPNITYLAPSSVNETQIVQDAELHVFPSVISAGGCRIEYRSNSETFLGASPRVEIIDLQGRRCAALELRESSTGIASAQWDGADESGNKLPSGIYWIHVDGASVKHSTKIVIIR